MEKDIKDTNLNVTPDMFKRVPKDDIEAEKIARPIITFWADVWRRLKMNKAAMISIGIIVLLVVLVIVGPMMTKFSFKDQDAQARNLAPSATHWFGTDTAGRDIWARVWVGGRVSITIGIVCAVIAMIVGVAYGSVAGLIGGKVDNIMMRIVEIISCLPYLLIVILVCLWLNKTNLGSILLALSLTSWTGTSRMVRGQVLAVKNEEYVLAARTLGVPTWKIIIRHIVPNVLAIVIVGLTFDIPGFIFSEAFLSYMGIGLQPPDVSWGIMANEAQSQMLFYPYQLFFPTMAIALTMLSFTLLGDGLRDALDPKLRK